MNSSTYTSVGQLKAVRGGKIKHQTGEPIGSRPSFASRVAKLLFRRGRSSAELRAKSWPGREEPVPVPVVASEVVPLSADQQPSASIVIPNSIGSSAPVSVPRTQSMRISKRSEDHTGGSQAEWRHRQAHCANCECLFFKSMSSLSSSAGRFCSLDCKANFEYVNLLQETMDLEFGSVSSGSLYSSLEGENDS